MGTWGQLREVESELTRDVVKTTIPFWQLAKKYGVSKQAIFGFCNRMRIRRPKREHWERCSICQGLLRIARLKHSDFISSPTIKKQLKVKTDIFCNHIAILRREGLISERFGKLRSTRVEQAYQIYFKKKLPIDHIGRQVGLKYFAAAIAKHKLLGWDVPPSLFKYDTAYRSKSHLKKNKRKRRLGKGK